MTLIFIPFIDKTLFFQGRSQNFFPTEAKETSARMSPRPAEMGFLGRGQLAPPRQLGGLIGAVSSPSWVRRPPNGFHAF